MQVQQQNRSRFIIVLTLFTIGVVIGLCGASQLISTKFEFPVDRSDFVLTESNSSRSQLG